MTPAQIQQFNFMLHTLKQIAKGYMTPAQLRKVAVKQYGCEYEEALEMAYENIQGDAAHAIKGIKSISIKPVTAKP